MATSYGNTWWGSHWLKSLDHIDYDNRLPRGRAYARNGSVKKVIITGNRITAKVAGSRPRPYDISITIPAFTAQQIRLLMDEIVLRPALISKLLNRELDPEILDIAERLGLKVFPKQWKDFKMDCNCPDWAVPCKHLAAVIYVVSQEIDNNPFLVFSMHCVDLPAELQRRGITIDTKEKREVPLLSDLLIHKKPRELSDEVPLFRRIDFSALGDLTEPLIQLLPANPPFYNNGDFREKYRVQLMKVVKNVQRVFNKKLDYTLLFPANPKPETITRRNERSVMIDDSGIWKEKNPDGLLLALTGLNPDFLADYQPGVAALHQTLFCSLHLLAHGAITPQIIQLPNKKLAIRWLPAMLDREVKKVIDQLDLLLPDGLLAFMPGERKTAIAICNQAESLVSLFLGRFIASLSPKTYDDLLLSLFFKSQPYAFAGVGQQETGGAIQVWLDRYYLTNRQYQPLFIVKEDAIGGFDLNICIEDTAHPDEEAAPLAEILTAKKYEQNRFRILQELTLLSSFVAGLNEYINRSAATPIHFSDATFAPFLFHIIPAIRLLNIRVILPKSLQQLIRPKATLRLTKKSATDEKAFLRFDDLLSFDWQIALGDEVIGLADFMKLTDKATGLLRFKQQYIYVDESDLEKIRKALAIDTLSPIQLLQAALTEEYQSATIQLSDEVRALIRELTSQEVIPLPESLQATLRPYQERGFSWMYRNRKIGFGSIMADDMGLGKTLQVITLLLKLKEEGQLQKEKALIVVPTGLLTNWQAEIERFAPSLTTFLYHGAARGLKEFDADLLLTTYGILRSDVALLKKKKWQVVVIDEAQNIKNQDTAQSKAIRSIPAATHIAMSGTPVENRLSEFWSIMDFANKNYLGTHDWFRKEYSQPIQVFNDTACAARFRKVTAPFMMRRMKSDKSIINDLPDKIELDKYARLTQPQAALYEQTLKAAMNEIEGLDTTNQESLFKRQGLILQMILALKQICNHPTQFLKDGKADSSLSGKTEMLLDLVESITASGEKVLIFTQFHEMGSLLQTFLEERLGERPMFYHGGCSLKERESLVARFQNNRADRVFLLSLKAAGTGLNLTAASHVIHYDLWWNPAVEAQATDRAYRIGQNKNVMVHRFITKDTFEERINDMIQKKKNLADMTVTSGESWIGKMSNKELKDLFG